MNTQIEDEIKELQVIVGEAIKDNVAEYLELNDEVEGMLKVEANTFNCVYIKVLGTKVFSLRRDIDCYETYHAKITAPLLYIKEDTGEKDIEKYNKKAKFVRLISSKEAFLKLKEIALSNILALNEEVEAMLEN